MAKEIQRVEKDTVKSNTCYKALATTVLSPELITAHDFLWNTEGVF